MQRPDAKNILIIKHGAFGDIIQVEGAVHDVRLNYLDARITVMTSPPFNKIFARCPWIDDIFLDTRPPRWRLDKMWALRRRLRAQPFDFVVDFQNNERTAFYFNHLFPPVAWSGKVKGASHRRSTEDPKQIQGLPRFATQLRDAGLEVRHAAAPHVSWMAEDVSAILAEAGVRPGYIVLIPGCSAKHPQKRWPYYAELAEKLHAAGHQTVTVPGPDELELCRALPSIIRAPPSLSATIPVLRILPPISARAASGFSVRISMPNAPASLQTVSARCRWTGLRIFRRRKCSRR